VVVLSLIVFLVLRLCPEDHGTYFTADGAWHLRVIAFGAFVYAACKIYVERSWKLC